MTIPPVPRQPKPGRSLQDLHPTETPTHWLARHIHQVLTGLHTSLRNLITQLRALIPEG